MAVAHQDRDIVTGTTDVMVDQQRGAMLGNMTPNAVQHLPRRTDMAADRTDIGFDDAEGDFHGDAPPLWQWNRVPASIYVEQSQCHSGHGQILHRFPSLVPGDTKHGPLGSGNRLG
jgi:hypothetical protein